MNRPLSFPLALIALCLAMPLAATNAAMIEEDMTCGSAMILGEPPSEEACERIATLLDELKRKPEDKIYVARQRAKEDVEKLRALLVSEGYFSATAQSDVSAQSPYHPRLHLTPGPRFRIETYHLIYEGDLHPPLADNPKALGIRAKASARGKDIVELESEVLSHLQSQGYPQAQQTGRKILAIFESKTANIHLTFRPGPFCTYGPTSVTGLERLKPEFVTSLVTFKTGKPCSLTEIEEERRKLGRTGLFSATDIRPSPEQEEDGTKRSMEVAVKEAKARTIGLGLSYATNRGAGGRIFWEHRNLLGAAENLRAEINIEEIKQEGTLSFRKPLPAKGATVFSILSLKTEARDAFDAQRYSVTLGTDLPINGPWRYKQSIEYEYADVEDAGLREAGHNIQIPLTLSQITVKEPLNTEDGIVLDLTVAPAYSTFGEGSAFVKFDGRVSHHLPLGKERAGERQKWGLSTWIHVGTLQGAATANISPTQLYYGGGSSSVRAIAWEHLGSIALDNTPEGGRSILDGGVEIRRHINKNWQLATFVEGGRVFKAQAPDLEQDLLWGGGFGLRYHTPIGPLRFDIATPFNPRETDDDVQVYIGLGQAF